MTPKHSSEDSNPLVVSDVIEKYEVTPDNTFRLVGKAHHGISAKAFYDVLSISGFSKTELAGLLDLSFKTIQRYHKQGKKLNALNSEQLLKMMLLFQKAEEVFGSVQAFNRWLRKPSIGLKEQRPFDLMRTAGGIDLIYEELSRIEHGILA